LPILSLTLFFPPILFSTRTPTAAIYSLSLHDALPIWPLRFHRPLVMHVDVVPHSCVCLGHLFLGIEPIVVALVLARSVVGQLVQDRKSTRLNSSHVKISYAVFCLRKKNKSRGRAF